ncbi:nitronate monooxygenase [Paenibacillus sp. yr247]|uniref:NAD(P)H-dependent flavin oxidoreductase n=1 Tax=Paenibacillus sp. yr247 TaxID=1761880 RepID=UPI0008925F5B|nr:nitronate monooxygenase [Paenibacillus sp. yr247]SDP24984.1 nitronate monooxygenase [Paenibacillus sp. yr247]
MSTNHLSHITEQMTLPVIAAPMFLISGPEMVIECCKTGIIGSFPLLNARTTDILDEWMKRISEELAAAKSKDPERRIAPWAVNLIVHKTNTRYGSDVELIKKYQPPIVITSLGAPGPIVELVHQYGGLVFSDVSTLTHARKAAQTGVDGLILVCQGAGGHAGTINPFAFMGGVREFWEGPVILAGCITTGQDIFAAAALGADFAYMGTRFIAASEGLASENYRNMLIESTSDDIIYTDAFSGVKGNFLIRSIRKAGLDPEKLEKKESVNVAHLNHNENKAWKVIWSAGQGVNAIKRVMPVADLVEELRQEFKQAEASLSARLSKNK